MTNVDLEACPYPFREADEQRLEIDPELKELQRKKSLVRIACRYGGDAWLAVGYDDAKFVMSDSRFSRSLNLNRDVPRIGPKLEFPLIITMDNPEHGRMRRLMSPAFTGRRVEALRPRIQQIVDACIDRIEENGPTTELIDALAMPVPVAVISHMLGIPLEDYTRFREWAAVMMAPTKYSQNEVDASDVALYRYLKGLVEQRRKTPTDDVLGVLVAARDAGDRLSEAELIHAGLNLLLGGYEPTSRMIAHFVYNLLTHQDQLDKLLADPGLLDSAIEEMLRFSPSLASASTPAWIATENVQVGSVLVEAGESVLVEMAAADRDEAVFDRPNELDLTREVNPHLGFGHGMHFCIGSQLARLELRIVIETLLRRLPGIRLAKPAEELQFASGGLLRCLTELPVTW